MIKVLNLWLVLAVGVFGNQITWTGEGNDGVRKPKSVNDVIWTGAEFVVGGTEYIAESFDGREWERSDLGTLLPDDYHSLVLGNGILALGEESAIFRTSGGEWTQCVLPDEVVIEYAAHDGSRFLGEDEGILYESLDGVNWEVFIGSQAYDFNGLVFGNGRWVGIDENNLFHSEDGLIWVVIGHVDAFVDPELMRYRPKIDQLEFSGGRFLVSMIEDIECGFNSYGVSVDGVNWQIAEAPPFKKVERTGGLFGFTFTGNSIGEGGKEIGPDLQIDRVRLSASGTPLVVHSGGLGVNRLNDFSIIFRFPIEFKEIRAAVSNDSGTLVAVGSDQSGGGTFIANESDTRFWEKIGIPSFLLRDAESDGETLVAAFSSTRNGASEESVLYYSTDGIDWSPCVLPDDSLLDVDGVRFVNGTWFLVSSVYPTGENVLHTSTDGIHWQLEEHTLFPASDDNPHIPELDALPVPVRGGSGNGWILGKVEGESGGFARSENGIDWQALPRSLSEATTGAFGNGHFVVLSKETAWTSIDGGEWSSMRVGGLINSAGGWPLSQLRYYRGRWLVGSPRKLLQAGEGIGLEIPPASYISDDLKSWWNLTIDSSFGNRFSFADSFEFHGWQIAGESFSKDGIRWPRSDVFRDGLARQFSSNRAQRIVSLGDRLVFLGHQFQTIRSHPVPINPTPESFRVIAPGYVESPADPEYEYRLNFSRNLGEPPWSPVGDWKSAGGVGPFLFWVTRIDDPFGFYRLEQRVKE